MALALDFVERRPNEAARVLERLPPPSIAAFLAEAPAAAASRVLGRMVPSAAAASLAPLPARAAAELLTGIDVAASAAVLRLLPATSRDALLAALPTRVAVQCRTLLRHAPTEIGALMDPAFAAVADDLSVEEARGRLADEDVSGGLAYVVGRDGRLRGVARPMRLMGADDNRPVASVMEAPPAGFSSRTAVVMALRSPIWAERDEAPVADAGGRMIGVLRFAALRGAGRGDGELAYATVLDTLVDVGLAYWSTLGSFVEALAEQDPGRRGGRSGP